MHLNNTAGLLQFKKNPKKIYLFKCDLFVLKPVCVYEICLTLVLDTKKMF